MRVLAPGRDLKLGVLTAIVGAPFFAVVAFIVLYESWARVRWAPDFPAGRPSGRVVGNGTRRKEGTMNSGSARGMTLRSGCQHGRASALREDARRLLRAWIASRWD